MNSAIGVGGYRVEESEFGVLVFGAIPLDDLVALQKGWARRGFKVMSPGIATAAGASIAVGSAASIEKWTVAVRAKVAKASNGDAELEWLTGPDTGLSSLTMFSVLSSAYGARAHRRLAPFGPCVPCDPDDFNRCRKLLQAVPGWRARLGEVADEYPEWKELVARWDDVEALFVEEFPKGRAPKTFALMQELV